MVHTIERELDDRRQRERFEARIARGRALAGVRSSARVERSRCGTVASVCRGADQRRERSCAGIDIKNPDALDHEALATRRRDTVAHCLDAILSFEKPLVAAINGPAIGLSCMIALLADQAIASDRAVFALPEIDIGIPTFLGASIVSRAVGMALARELVLTGRQISAADARQHHLVGSVVAHEELERSAQDAAKMLAAKPRAAYALNKRWLARDLRAEFDAANAHSKAAQAELAADKARHPH